ncbi:2-aminoethylphosphonate ABC transporter permease subunit [Gordonia sp. (in: high G+C Gram-positive bacteria)]|uniref:2-aminoethylphosphonate ABC transporter permease subunit n=1 Tax=Gordonia sp. (in: high G+C Gram-positive bacteria) TaxID=84139 RepID=UPI00169AFFF1|nr:2-aminoethylphosphonate ABC transporter permease subunit [Gordonia sp. (in: high G+C Gram-positive bacteria)]NLG47292.1 2-aminoethylphosphonate ABC transporter permease subunit [Gordonia sp. (in: high G+C Gram-positive bacteria)]
MTATLPPPTAPATPARAPRRFAGAPTLALLIGPLVVLALGLGYPLVWVVSRSLTDRNDQFAGLATWTAALSDPAVHRAFWRTLEIAAFSTVGCVVVGTFIAFVLAFIPFPGTPGVVRLIEAVVSLPSFLIPLALGVLFGPVGVIASSTGQQLSIMSSVYGVVLAEIAFYTPFVVRPLLAAFSQFPAAQIDVASSLGAGPVRIATRVILPRVWPALAAATSLTFLLTLNEFGIVLFTGAKDVMTLPMMIYTKSMVSSDFATAAVLATIQLALSVSVYLGYRTIVRRLDTKTGD